MCQFYVRDFKTDIPSGCLTAPLSASSGVDSPFVVQETALKESRGCCR